MEIRFLVDLWLRRLILLFFGCKDWVLDLEKVFRDLNLVLRFIIILNILS